MMPGVTGRSFWKMTGSGNDFVFFDARSASSEALETPQVIGAICARRTGIGADGVVFLDADPECPFGIRYFNRDGSLAELCGNASLCSVTLACALGVVGGGGDFTFMSTSGPLTGRLAGDQPEIDLAFVTEELANIEIPLAPGEQRIGFARVGVPHLVVLVDDVDRVDAAGRGRDLRHWPSLRDGANANFVSRNADGWAIRTYERGVEEETLACGTGAVATCALLSAWNMVPGEVDLRTKSFAHLLATAPRGSTRRPSLRGEGRVVFSGTIGDLETDGRRP